MLHKILYGIIGGAILLVIGSIFGLIIGAFIGGNYFTAFEFFGVRGYEAVGDIGALQGAAIGALLGALMGVINWRIEGGNYALRYTAFSSAARGLYTVIAGNPWLFLQQVYLL